MSKKYDSIQELEGKYTGLQTKITEQLKEYIFERRSIKSRRNGYAIHCTNMEEARKVDEDKKRMVKNSK